MWSGTEISVIIVHWNTWKTLGECLSSIDQNASSLVADVIVVDNASNSACPELREAFPGVHWIDNPVNLGFARAVNQAFEKVHSPFVLLLNPDAQLRRDSLQTMLHVLKSDASIGLVGPRIVDAHRRYVPYCCRPAHGLGAICRTVFPVERVWRWLRLKVGPESGRASGRRPPHGIQNVGCIQGSAMLLRKDLLSQLDGVDDRVPLYLEDIDLCERVRKTGYRVVFVYDAEVMHQGASSVAKLSNPAMSSLVNYLAWDVFFLKHRNPGWVLAHHAVLATAAVLYLIANVILLPVSLVGRKWVLHYLHKHIQMLSYALFFRFFTDALPAHWPRSLRQIPRQGSAQK